MFRHIRSFIFLISLLLLLAGCGKKEAPAAVELSSATAGELTENSVVVADAVADVFPEPDLKSQRVMQLLLNQRVEILEEQGAWSRIGIDNGTVGWVKTNLLSKDLSCIDPRQFKYKIIITSRSKKISSHTKGGVTIVEAAMGTELYSRGKIDNNYEVALPGGVMGWVAESGTIQVGVNKDIPVTTAADFISTAAKFKGTSYMTGGNSCWGIDAPGLVHISAKINGVSVSRDLSELYKAGTAIDIKAVTPGDLLFFTRKGNKQEISTVGIYVGDGKFLDANSTKGYVVSSSLKDDHNNDKLIGARRIFNH